MEVVGRVRGGKFLSGRDLLDDDGLVAELVDAGLGCGVVDGVAVFGDVEGGGAGGPVVGGFPMGRVLEFCGNFFSFR